MAQGSIESQLNIKIKNALNAKCSFVHSFRPIYIVSRIFGQMPFSIAYNANGAIDRPVVHKLDVVWFVIAISVFTWDIYHYLKRLIMCQKCVWEVISVTPKFIYTIERFLGLLAIILDMCYRFKLFDVFKKIIIFDKRASSTF